MTESHNISKQKPAAKVGLDTVNGIIMDNLKKNIQGIAKSNSNVFVIGEYGSGRGRTAHTIHIMSSRARQGFEKTLCITQDSAEIKEKLFGRHPDSQKTMMIKPGSLEMAYGGTLFLEGFPSLPYEVVTELMSVLKNGYFRNIGGRRKISLDVRLIVSISEKDFELFGKSPFWNKIITEIDPVILKQPPLRERREDIPLLMHKFLEELKSRYPFLKVRGITPSALYRCLQYSWPGNVRQLKNATTHATFFCNGEWIDTSSFPSYLNSSLPQNYLDPGIEKSKSFALAERELIYRVLKQSESFLQASEALGYSIDSLKQKLKQYHLKSTSFK